MAGLSQHILERQQVVVSEECLGESEEDDLS